METALVTEARPADRWIEANARSTARKTRKDNVPGGINENRAKLIAVLAEAKRRRLARTDRVFCPECSAVYARSYVSKHRQTAHGVKARSSIHHGEYVPSYTSREYVSPRVLCPECGADVSSHYISTHRKRYHGVESPATIHAGYVRVP